MGQYLYKGKGALIICLLAVIISIDAGCSRGRNELVGRSPALLDNIMSVSSAVEGYTTNNASNTMTDNEAGITDSGLQSSIKTEKTELQVETLKPVTAGESSLHGRIICIDPGHQEKANYEMEPIAPGSDEMKEKMSWGTSGITTGVPEYMLNLAVSLRLRDALVSEGADIIITREQNDIDLSNIDRAKMANDSNAEMVIRIHADGVDNSTVKGISVLYPGSNFIRDEGMISKSRIAADMLLIGITASVEGISRGLSERNDLTGFNWSTVPVVLVEMGFMTNSEEDMLLNNPAYQDKIVQGIVNGLKAYFGQKN